MSALKVLIGKDGWLFLDNDTNRVIDQISGTYNLPANFRDAWSNLFLYRMDKSKELGFQYCYSIVPNKESVYHKYLPDGVKHSEERPVRLVLDCVPPGMRSCYLLDELLLASEYNEVYTKGDTHWNYIGALCGFNKIASILGLGVLTSDDYTLNVVDIPGDLSSKCGLPNSGPNISLLNKKYRVVDDNGVSNIGKRIVFRNDDQSLPSCILFRDSFSDHQLEFYASRFSRLICLWQPNLDYEFIAKERPDFVIQQQVERFLVDVPDDLHGLSHAHYESRKLKGIP
jgi:hypothetical protein